MRLALVHPAGSNWVPGREDITVLANRMAPIGLLSLAAWLEGKGHQVSVHDCLGPKAPNSLEANVRLALASRPEMVGFSCTTSGFLDAHEMALLIKQRHPEIKTVFGGVHVSAIGAPLLGRFPAIDYLVIGEGEHPLSELLDGKSPKEIAGLCFRDGEQLTSNARPAGIKDLDALPFPVYEKLQGFPKGYHLPPFSYVLRPGATMITSRGCPYVCSYCDRSVFQRAYRYNSAEYVYEHMKLLRQRFGVRHINVYDDLFTAHKKRVVALCELLRTRPLGIQFNCAVRVGHTDDDLLAMLKGAGCLMVSLGIESADPEMIVRHKAGVTLDQVRDTVGRIQKAGLRSKGLFMMGLPGETEETFRVTSDFILSLGLDDMNMSKFTPFPGAPSWATIHQEGTFTEDWRLMNCLNAVFVPSGIASKERMDELYNQHVKRFYSDKQWRRRFVRRLWQHRATLWHMLLHLPGFLAAKRQFEPKEQMKALPASAPRS